MTQCTYLAACFRLLARVKSSFGHIGQDTDYVMLKNIRIMLQNSMHNTASLNDEVTDRQSY